MVYIIVWLFAGCQACAFLFGENDLLLGRMYSAHEPSKEEQTFYWGLWRTMGVKWPIPCPCWSMMGRWHIVLFSRYLLRLHGIHSELQFLCIFLTWNNNAESSHCCSAFSVLSLHSGLPFAAKEKWPSVALNAASMAILLGLGIMTYEYFNTDPGRWGWRCGSFVHVQLLVPPPEADAQRRPHQSHRLERGPEAHHLRFPLHFVGHLRRHRVSLCGEWISFADSLPAGTQTHHSKGSQNLLYCTL